MTSRVHGQNEFIRELAAESITVRIRWFGLCVGYVLVNAPLGRETLQPQLNAILTLGAVYALLDTLWSLRGKVFLTDFRPMISLMEAVFIGLLCYFDEGLESPFRFYYFLSLLVCAIRHEPRITFLTFGLHAISYVALALSLDSTGRNDWPLLFLMLVFMAWVTWAITAFTGLLKSAGHRLLDLNDELQQNQAQLEQRIAERTRELQESQALLVQQEKQAAFGLLAAGIAHEVGNPLASISSLVQMLKRREPDDYTRERLDMVDDQLRRIQRTLRELVDFSRPAVFEQARCDIHEIIGAALNIAKYYKRKKGKEILTRFDADCPQLRVVRDQLVQVILNLILNAMDATEEGQSIEIATASLTDHDDTRWITVSVTDTGCGIPAVDQNTIFQPYFTTKDTGTGLGLFVCRRIVQEIRGRIELTSSSPDGTSFTLHLPAKEVADARETAGVSVTPREKVPAS